MRAERGMKWAGRRTEGIKVPSGDTASVLFFCFSFIIRFGLCYFRELVLFLGCELCRMWLISNWHTTLPDSWDKPPAVALHGDPSSAAHLHSFRSWNKLHLLAASWRNAVLLKGVRSLPTGSHSNHQVNENTRGANLQYAYTIIMPGLKKHNILARQQLLGAIMLIAPSITKAMDWMNEVNC